MQFCRWYNIIQKLIFTQINHLMKKTTFLITSVLLATSSIAQTYFFDDFESGLDSNWRTSDLDGDGYNWDTMNYAGSTLNFADQGMVASSSSYLNGVGKLTPDNILSSKAIDLSSATGTTYLQWVAGTNEASGNGWYKENYSVYISTVDSFDVANATEVFTEVLPEEGAKNKRIVDISAYNDSTIYLHFRHHNCSDMWRLELDDVFVGEVAGSDAAMVKHSLQPYVGQGNVNITGTISNEGATAITTVDIYYDAGAGPVMDKLTGLNIAPYASYDFTHATALAAVGGTAYDITLSVLLPGDTNSTNDNVKASMIALDQVPVKKVIGEEATGTWCQYCPYGAVGLSEIAADTNFIGIAVHSGDPMTVKAYSDFMGAHPLMAGYPTTIADRVIAGHGSKTKDLHNQRILDVVPAAVTSITTSLDLTTRELTVSADAEFYYNMSEGSFRLACVITEDDVVSGASADSTGSWNQTNAITSTLVDPVSGFNWGTAGNSVAPSAFGGYDHTARILFGGEANGVANSIPSATKGKHSFTFPVEQIPANYDATKMHAVVMIVDQNSGQILNSNMVNVNTPVSAKDYLASQTFEVFPNPANNDANVAFELNNTQNVSVEIMSALGQIVAKQNLGKTNGFKEVNFNTQNLQNGIYYINLKVGEDMLTKKITILK